MKTKTILIKIYLFLDKHFIGYFKALMVLLFVSGFFKRLIPFCFIFGILAFILSAYGENHKWYEKYGGTGNGTEI